MNTRTCSRFSSTVSTWKKSTARIPAAWACRNCRHVGPARRGAGSMPGARRISQTVDCATVTPSFVPSPWIRRIPTADSPSPAGHQGGRCQAPRRPAGFAPVARVVLARGQLAVPGQQRAWRHWADFGPAVAGYEPCQRGEPHPVRRLILHPAGVPAQHRVLVPEHEQFSILRPVAAEQHDRQAEHPARQQIDDLEQHPPSQPSLRSSCWQQCRWTDPIEYSSGTGS